MLCVLFLCFGLSSASRVESSFDFRADVFSKLSKSVCISAYENHVAAVLLVLPLLSFLWRLFVKCAPDASFIAFLTPAASASPCGDDFPAVHLVVKHWPVAPPRKET